MKVLHVISSGGMYGAEAVILNLCRELQVSREGTGAIAVFAPSSDEMPALYEAAVRAGIEAHLVVCAAQMDREVPRRLRELARQTGADVIHAHGYKADVYCFLAFRKAGPTLVSTCHTWYDNDWALRVYGALDRFVLRRFAGVVAVSPEVRERLHRSGVSQNQVRLIRNGVDLTAFEHAPAERERRQQNGGPLRVGLVGRFAPEKGIDIFLRAVEEVARCFPAAQFVVAGDGPDRVSLERSRTELGLEGKVEMAGQQTDMPAFYSSIDLLVSASRQEGLPVALLEGMASGLPVVATGVGAVPQAVQNGLTGLLVQPEAPAALAKAMKDMLASRDLLWRFGKAGQARVREEFSAGRMTSDYLALYRHVLAERVAAQRSEAVADERH